MWIWVEYGWVLTAVVWLLYALLATIFALLFHLILRARSTAALIVLGSIAIPIAVALVRFGIGLTP